MPAWPQGDPPQAIRRRLTGAQVIFLFPSPERSLGFRRGFASWFSHWDAYYLIVHLRIRPGNSAPCGVPLARPYVAAMPEGGAIISLRYGIWIIWYVTTLL